MTTSTFSFQANTDEGKVLISPDALNLHFVGYPEYSGIGGGGPNTTYWTITCPSRPLVFATMGFDDVGCIVDVTQINTNVWRIETLGNPGLACFAPLTNEAPRSPYGMRILKDNGQVAFDSTRCPLYLVSAFQFQYPVNTPLSSIQVAFPSGVLAPFITAYAFAFANGPNPPIGDDGHPEGTVGRYYLGVHNTGTGWEPIWLEYVDGTTGYPADVTPYAINFTILVSEGYGVE